ncbi:FecCD family ABC transporter permease [Tomitella cavernea]|uniref:Iron ABC transporter permease n=1 Tax=Tomitella cavernea TaxID=1387982 RepID=A0ABP9CZT0_9ACTN|nr:iron ABC transporter permease [Tomitella cavernea]
MTAAKTPVPTETPVPEGDRVKGGAAAAARPPDGFVVRAGGYSVVLARRGSLVVAVMAVCAAALVVASLLTDSAGFGTGELFAGLFGRAGNGVNLLVQQIFLPRVVCALLAGAGLGAAGCLSQTLARNRLATPDMLGVSEGATTAMLAVAGASVTGLVGAWWAGPVGAAAAGLVVVLLAGGMGRAGYRVLIVGVALTTMLSSVTQLVLATQNINSAGGSFLWTMGSLNGRGYETAVPVAVGLAVLFPLALLMARRLGVLRLDDATAATLGLRPDRTRLAVLAVAVGMAGLAVGVGGPIGFVALAAPVIASRLAGPARVPVLSSAVVGAVLVVAADLAARTLAPVEIPAGVVTAVLGGPFLLWVLLSREGGGR